MLQMPFDDCRVAGDEDIIGHIMHDHAAGRHDHPVADGHARADGNIAAEPAVLADGYRMRSLLGFATKDMILGMLRSIKLTMGPDKGITADGHICAVKNDTPVIHEDAFRKTYTVSMIAAERRTDVRGSRNPPV